MHARFHRHILAAVAATAALIAVPTGAAAAVITFDDMAAPPLLGDAVPLTTQYSAEGVTFSGTGAVLDAELSDFLLTDPTGNIVGYSGFTRIDFGGAQERESSPFDVLTFATPISSVSFFAASGLNDGSMFSANAFNMSGQLVDSASLTLMSRFQRVSLAGMGITRLEYGFDDEFDRLFGEFAIDNLEFNGASVPEPMTLSLFATALGAMAFVRRRRN